MSTNIKIKIKNMSHIGFINETIVCMHELYNQQLVASGQAKTLAEAAQMPRDIKCSCSKCNQK